MGVGSNAEGGVRQTAEAWGWCGIDKAGHSAPAPTVCPAPFSIFFLKEIISSWFVRVTIIFIYVFKLFIFFMCVYFLHVYTMCTQCLQKRVS